MRGSTGALGVFGGIIRLRSSQGRQFGSLEAGLSEHVTTGARREHRSGRPAGTKPTRAAAKASISDASPWRPDNEVSQVSTRGEHAGDYRVTWQRACMSSLGDSSQRRLSDVAAFANRLEVGHRRGLILC